MKNARRAAAIAAIVLLVSMYVLCLIFALIKNDHAVTLFRAALGCTIAVPILLYAFLMLHRRAKKYSLPAEEADEEKKD